MWKRNKMFSGFRFSVFGWGLGLLSSLLVVGCAVGPDFVRPQPPEVTQYTQGKEPTVTVAADGQTQEFNQGAEIAAEWWELFKSPKLDDLIKEAIAGNRSLQAAQARLRQSQDLLRAGYGVFFPQVSGNYTTVRQKFSPAQFGSSGSGSSFTLFTAQASISYVLDVFGGQRRTVEGLAAQAEYQNFTAQATYNTLIGNVVNTAIAQAAYRAQIEATEQIIAFQKEQLRLTTTQANAGTVPYTSVVSLQAQLASTEATLPPLRQNLNKTQHLLAALVGRTPGEVSSPAFVLKDFTLPPKLPVTLPSELVRRRPDILAAEAQVHNASANIGVATAAMFPNFTLSTGYGQNIDDVVKIFGTLGNVWNVGVTLAQPLFQGGTLWFKRKAAMQAYEAYLADYRQTVVTAFQQVADTLRAVEHDAQTLKAQSEALAAADQTLQLVKANYEAGLVNYLQILTANNQYQQASLGYIQAQALRLQDNAALIVALGGGWWNPGTKN